jgi:hypothetical protein
MYADYSRGLSLRQIGRLYPMRNGRPRDGRSVGAIFALRHLNLRGITHPGPRRKNGTFVPDPPKTEKELAVMIAALTRLKVPDGLANEWRAWPLAKRRAFIARLRGKFPSTRPTTPFSENVEPFEYGSPNVHALADRLNAGLDSKHQPLKLKPASEGVIFKGQVFFWVQNTGYQIAGGFRRGAKRLLNQVVWMEANRRPVPEGMTVVHVDGNKNNFAPANLALRSMADCMRENTIHRLPPERRQKSRERSSNAYRKTITLRSRRQTNLLLQEFQGGGETIKFLVSRKLNLNHGPKS